MFVEAFNVFEAILWMSLAVYALVASRRSASRVRHLARRLSGLLVLFAISEAIEVGTGAPWRPWWLLAFKAFCVIGLGGTLWLLAAASRETRSSNPSA